MSKQPRKDTKRNSFGSIEKTKPASSSHNDVSYGIPLQNLKRAPSCYTKPLGELRASKTHKIFFETADISKGGNTKRITPYPYEFKDSWDDNHVRMPYSGQSLISLNDQTVQRWEKIEDALSTKIRDVFSLGQAILSYNLRYKTVWNFRALENHLEEKDAFFEETLPKMQALALKLPSLVTKSIPLLRQGRETKLTFSQEQVACLLANAFFCTFPHRNMKLKSKDALLPDINFSPLYSDSRMDRKEEKLKCIIHYFERILKDEDSMPSGIVSYTRQVLIGNVSWEHENGPFTQVHARNTGTIEDDGAGMLQADFANKFVGGGVLGHGCVQEGIRFLICPEMILSRLFTERLRDDEVLIMTGCERFSNYTGYADSFQFSGDHKDETKLDGWRRRCTEVVAMDALVMHGYKIQFEKDQVNRELNKAFCAFKGNEFDDDLPAVCTGNWGCGAFGGDKHLKAVIQLMAASKAGRDVCYFTFGDEILCKQLARIAEILKKEEAKIKDVYRILRDYEDDNLKYFQSRRVSLFEYIATTYGERLNIVGADSQSQDASSPPDTDDYESSSDNDFASWELLEDDSQRAGRP